MTSKTPDPASLWTYSFDEELWPPSVNCTTKEEAIEAARYDVDFSDPEDTVFWVGQPYAPRLPPVNVAQVLDRLGDEMYDGEDGGEWAEDWPNLSPDDSAELGRRLTEVVHAFLQEKSPPPWFCIRHKEQHTREPLPPESP